jgi:hypothetical protein
LPCSYLVFDIGVETTDPAGDARPRLHFRADLRLDGSNRGDARRE